MEPSSLFVEHHEFPDVLVQPFLSVKQKAARTKCYVEEWAGGDFQRKFGDGEAEIYEFGYGEAGTFEFGVVQYVACEERSSARYVSDSDTPVNDKAAHGGVSTCVWKQMRDTSQYQAEHSQARQQ